MGLDDENEKRVKAVAVLNKQAPHILQEIFCETASSEEDEMEVVLGPRHYEIQAEKKDRELWRRIREELGLKPAKAIVAKNY